MSEQLQHNYNQYFVQPMDEGAINTGDGSTNLNSFGRIMVRFSSIFEFDPSKPLYSPWGHGPVHPIANNSHRNDVPGPSSSTENQLRTTVHPSFGSKPDYTLWGDWPPHPAANNSHQNDGQGYVSGHSPSSSTGNQIETTQHPSFWSRPEYNLWGYCPVHPTADYNIWRYCPVHPTASNSHQNDGISGPSPSSSTVNELGTTEHVANWSNPYYTLWGHGPVQSTANNSHQNDGQGCVSGATSSSLSANQLWNNCAPN